MNNNPFPPSIPYKEHQSKLFAHLIWVTILHLNSGYFDLNFGIVIPTIILGKIHQLTTSKKYLGIVHYHHKSLLIH